jgi:tetratricopeptide (TPR) repeat protein
LISEGQAIILSDHLEFWPRNYWGMIMNAIRPFLTSSRKAIEHFSLGCRVLALSMLVVGLSAAKRPAHADDYYDIGDFQCKVTTESQQAQTWFDRGLAMCHAFNHEEGFRCFQKAHQADPKMPMALWGMAYALGPNINLTVVEPHVIAQAQLAAQLAKNLEAGASPWERDLINALLKRYAVPAPETLSELNKSYADAMREVHQKHADHPTVTALFAESLMMLRPWNYFGPDGKPAPETPEIVSVLEQGLQRWPGYPALCHFYIHTIEASPEPLKALPAADRLLVSMPGSGHLVHMPSHIYAHAGDYAKVIETNQQAIEIDKAFVQREGRHNFYTFYRIHNYHFLVYGAMFDGQSELAMNTARMIAEQVPEDMLVAQVDFLDAFMATPLHVLVRFGRWDDILKEPKPADHLPMTQSIWRYARGVAYAATGKVDEAKHEQVAFLETKELVPETSILFNNTSRDILGVAEAMLAGEIAYRAGQHDQAYEHLRTAVKRDDALNYDEPWGWMQPARHALGALLLEQDHAAEAEFVYREDLKRHPNNVWSLHGLAESLGKQGRGDEADALQKQLTDAGVRADVKVNRSCFCRQAPTAEEPEPAAAPEATLQEAK